MKQLTSGIILSLVFLSVLSCTKQTGQQVSNLPIERVIEFRDYSGWVKEIQENQNNLRLYIQGNPKDRLITLDSQDSVLDDIELFKGSLFKFLENGNYVQVWDQNIQIYDGTDTKIQDAYVLPTWPSPTVYNTQLNLTDDGFAVLHRFAENNTNDLYFRITGFSSNGDSLKQKTFAYPHEKMSTVIDFVSLKNQFLIIGTYGHSGAANGYKLLFLNNNLDTVWSQKIPDLAPAHYYMTLSDKDHFYIVHSKTLSTSWHILPIDEQGVQGTLLNFSTDLPENISLYSSGIDFLAFESYWNVANKSKMALLDHNLISVKTLSNNIGLNLQRSFLETTDFYLVGGSRVTNRDYPVMVKLRK